MSESKHKALLSELVAEKQAKRKTKSNHTLYLDTDNFLHLKDFCKEQGVTPSEVMDKLLRGFVEDALTEGTLSFQNASHQKKAG